MITSPKVQLLLLATIVVNAPENHGFQNSFGGALVSFFSLEIISIACYFSGRGKSNISHRVYVENM